MGTWIGGSANMVAVKEILGLPDGGLGPLVIVDTILSYAWMALLLAAARYQRRFDEVFVGGEKTDFLLKQKEHVINEGASSVREIATACRAGTSCGSCVPSMKQMLEEKRHRLTSGCSGRVLSISSPYLKATGDMR